MRRTRVNWQQLLEELAWLLGEPVPAQPEQRDPLSTSQLADALGQARGTLRGWIDGSEPKHADGERLLDRWCTLTGKAREFAPVERW
jgi:hypothetical protein